MKVSRRSLASILAVTSVSFSLASCMSTGDGWFNPKGSTSVADLSPAASAAITNDIVAKLAQSVGPGTGTVLLKMDKSQFGAALMSALHGHGYAVAEADQKPAGDQVIPLSYTVNRDGANVLVRITTPSVELSGTYLVTPDGAAPSAPVAVLTRAK